MSTYKKHVWGSGIPNRKKFDEMDSEIEKLSQEGGLPPTEGNLGKPLKVGSSGPMWGNFSSEYVNYDDTQSYPANSVGAELTSLSEKIVNKVVIDTTQDIIVGQYIFMDDGLKKSKPIRQKTFVLDSDFGQNLVIENIDKLVSYFGYWEGNGNLMPIISSISDSGSWIDLNGINIIGSNSSDKFNILIGSTITGLISHIEITFQYTLSTDTPTVIE